MTGYLERIIEAIYRKCKGAAGFVAGDHPDEETLACFLEDRLPREDRPAIEKHLVACPSCAEYVGGWLKMQDTMDKDVPPLLLEKVRKMAVNESADILLEIVLKLKEKVIEIIRTSGDVLVGQELVPAPVLRSRRIKDFKEEVVILKDLQSIRVEARLKNNNAASFNLTIAARDKQSQKLIGDLRVTLLKGKLELESYASEGTGVIFRDIPPGVYSAQVTKGEEKIAVVEIKAEV